MRLGFRDPASDKYVGAPEVWDRAEAALEAVCESVDLPDMSIEAGEAAFYGPKADFVVTDCIGREWQLGTVQLDYNLPSAERFGLEYIGADNQPHRPVMIHRAPLGSMERFIGVLIEHFAGAFPLWLAPEQVRVLTVSEKSEDYGREVEQQLTAGGSAGCGRLPRREAGGQDPRSPARADPLHVRRRRKGPRRGQRHRPRPAGGRPGPAAAWPGRSPSSRPRSTPRRSGKWPTTEPAGGRPGESQHEY